MQATFIAQSEGSAAMCSLKSNQTPSPAMDGTPVAERRSPVFVVGVGASAGGLEALERLFENMPNDTGLAFVVVQHLSPDFKSVMAELLARKTNIPIHRVEDGMEVKPDAIYLIPPKKDMIISNGRLLLTDKDPRQLVTLPIDHMFRSLAGDCADRCAAIILSGTGSDGSRGIQDIRDVGGLVIAQTPDSAKFDGMPKSAIQTGACDLILPLEEIPNALLRYIKHPGVLENAPHPPRDASPENAFDFIFRLLREAYGIDFSQYKTLTVARRIDRRLLLMRAIDLDDYVKSLRDNPDELNALYKDLLIGVTRFFRDTEAYEQLSKSTSNALVEDSGRTEEFRVWVAGCATGEEAYSLAIVLHECFAAANRPINVKIFATDVHRTSLDVASAGLYTEAQLVDVAPERLRRYFVQKGDSTFQVTQELRQLVVFAHHNLLRDAPFTKLDLVSCRNLLIYFQEPAQRKVLSLFHFGMRTGGILFLGPSESPGELSDEFSAMDTHWRIYRKRRDIRLLADLRLPLSPGSTLRPAMSKAVLPARGVFPDQHILGTYDELLDRFMPPSLLVNEEREVVESFGGANRFLQVKPRRISTDVCDLVDPALKVILSGALPRVFQDQQSTVYKGIRVAEPTVGMLINVTISPVENKRSSNLYALVTLETEVAPASSVSPPSEVDFHSASREQVLALESELRYAKENLQASIEELETSNEELQATNEELVASNEELQSTNEELHSVNEELYTVNAEYQKKITELTELTADMDNLLESTQVHTLFLDRDLRIRKFTPRIADTFNLLPQDVGRRIDSFTHGIDYPDLTETVQWVMSKGCPFEKQVQDQRGKWYLLRILPYHSKDAINGVGVTLIDLSKVKQAEAQARAKDQQLSTILKNSPHLVYIKDLEGRFLLVDETFKNISAVNPIGRTAFELFPRETAEFLTKLDERVVREGSVVEGEFQAHRNGTPCTFLAVKFPLHDDEGKIVGVGGISTDVTHLKFAERKAQEAVEQRDRFLAMLSHELRNPLGAIVNAANVLDTSSEGAPGRGEPVKVIQRQADHMSRLLDDLLDVSRISKDKVFLRKETIRLDELLSDALRVVQPSAEQNKLALSANTVAESILVSGDPARIQQMFVNLLTNAVKYTPSGGAIAVELVRDGDEALCRVADSGVGIHPSMLNRIFDLFVQADNTLDRSAGGLGVGLTLVKNIAELHGGTVNAQSEGAGKGSIFTLRLPVASSPLLQEESPEARQPTRPVSVVIVEDNDDSRQMFEAFLKLDGHEVKVARDGEEGARLILEQRPEVAFIDIGLPKLSGYELARYVRQQFAGDGLYLVALTGYGRPEDRKAVMEAGFNAHVVKPAKLTELEAIIRHVQKPRS
jgi:two-component system CheB/CheR fusion protein